MPAATVLIVEDDESIVDLVSRYLRRDGYKVMTATDGERGLELARAHRPDLLLLDLMLPGIDGRTVCRVLREETDMPIVMLTAMVEEEDKLAGLDLGADDYVAKPFSPRELAARVRAVLRRTSRLAIETGPRRVKRNGIVVDMERHIVEVDGRPVQTTRTERRLLATMMQQPGRVFSRKSLITHAFGDDFVGFDRTVDTHVANLRRKIENGSGKSRCIQTVYGEGYRFVLR